MKQQRNRNKHKSGTATTLNGSVITNVALDKNGMPILNDKMGFITVGINSGSVKDRSNNDRKRV